MERKVTSNGKSIDLANLAWKKWRKKPILISAVKMYAWFQVETLEGVMEGQPGDWLIQGIEGELYPCKDSVFQATYECPDLSEQ